MRQRIRIAAIGCLLLGPWCPASAQAFSYNGHFGAINSSGDTIKIKCSGSSSPLEFANGVKGNITCSTSLTMIVQATGDEAVGTEYSVSHDCGSNYTKESTVSAGTGSNDLSLAHSCVAIPDNVLQQLQNLSGS